MNSHPLHHPDQVNHLWMNFDHPFEASFDSCSDACSFSFLSSLKVILHVAELCDHLTAQKQK